MQQPISVLFEVPFSDQFQNFGGFRFFAEAFGLRGNWIMKQGGKGQKCVWVETAAGGDHLTVVCHRRRIVDGCCFGKWAPPHPLSDGPNSKSLFSILLEVNVDMMCAKEIGRKCHSSLVHDCKQKWGLWVWFRAGWDEFSSIPNVDGANFQNILIGYKFFKYLLDIRVG